MNAESLSKLTMTIENIKDGKLITLSKPFDTRAKYLNFFYFLSFFIGGTLFTHIIITNFSKWVLVIIGLLAVFSCFIAAYRFLNKTLESEKIYVDKQTLKLIRTGFLKFQAEYYETSKISNFCHLAKPEITKHPLAGETFDYLGFQTEQAVINEMYGDNRLSFSYLGKTITFGENISSWEFTELEILFYEITGNDFRYDDEFEKTFDRN